jgi:glycerol-3-phosphate dehydrogenase (NAD(P)+)
MKVTVIGDGGWGTALAMVLARNGHETTVWGPFENYIEQITQSHENSRYLADVKLPESIQWTAAKAKAAQADMIVMAVPSKFFRDVAIAFAPHIKKNIPVVSVAKGFDDASHALMTDLLLKTWPTTQVAALSGPSHAEEVARGLPTAVVVATPDPKLAGLFQQALATPRLRIYTTDDIIGVQIGGAVKNVIAIAVGVSDGLGFGDNTRAALITRGLAEITRLGIALGADPATFAGLSGMGDLVVTCTSTLSRNYRTGQALAAGQSLSDIQAATPQVAEGVWNAKLACAVANKLNVDVPISDQVRAVIYDGKSPQDAVEDLLSRNLGPEQH